MSKASKGTVVVEVVRDRLRLRWSWQGKRFYFSLELNATALNRLVADQKAAQIQGDMATGNFDPSLAKYKQPERRQAIAVTDLFAKFIAFKKTQLDSRTLEKYQGLQKHLENYFGNKSADIHEKAAIAFKDRLAEKLAPVTLKERIGLLKACWDWGIKKKLLEFNPWEEIKIKVPPKQRAKPFSKQEISAILDAFRQDKTYNYYADFVEFLFATGCRTGEAIGLKWKHLADDCSSIWFGEIHSRGRTKPVKRNRERTVKLNPNLQQILLNRKATNSDLSDDDFVFTAPEGGAIDDHNFRNRAWKPIPGLKQKI
jgi:integrase